MKNIRAFGFCAVLAIFAGCGEDDAKIAADGISSFQPETATAISEPESVTGHDESSRDVVMRGLEELGMYMGFDAGRGRIVAVETRGFSLKGEDADGDVECSETYDFHDDADDDFETKRFKTMWKAYADGLAIIARIMNEQMSDAPAGCGMGIDKETKNVQSAAQLSLCGVLTVASAESLDAGRGEYESTVAVCWSNKRQKLYMDSLSGNCSIPPGRYSLEEWLDEKSSMGMICPQSFVDNEGVWWRVAGVPVDLSTGRYSKKVALLIEKAKRYAFEAATRTIAVDVSASMSLMSTSTVHVGGEEKIKDKISRKVSIKPLRDIAPNDPFRVKWLELDKVNPFTGKPVRLIVCSIRDDADARDAERKFFKDRLIKERQEAYERGRRDAERLMPKKAND